MSATLLEQIRGDGLTLTLTDGDRINYHGAAAIVAKWLPELKAHKAEIIQDLKSEARFTDWHVHYNQSEKWVVIPDGATRDEVEALYPAAVKVEPFKRPPSRLPTPAERVELRQLVTQVLKDAPEEIEEALSEALCDVDAALTCYRALTQH